MAEEKPFRYGLIVLGFFLVMIGMFIMSVERPQIYITFCTLGILTIVVGVTWSMCQCYPKSLEKSFSENSSQNSHRPCWLERVLWVQTIMAALHMPSPSGTKPMDVAAQFPVSCYGLHTQKEQIRVVTIDAESERFLIKKPGALSLENTIPEKNSSQTPYTSQKQADVYEKSLPSYEQVQKNMAGVPAECLGALPVAPVPLVREEEHIQQVVEAKAEVHRNSESDGDACNDPGSQKTATRPYHRSVKFHSQAPLASLQDEMDASSTESTPNSPLLQKWKVTASAVSPSKSQLRFKLPCYEDFALIDSVMLDDQNQTMPQNQSHGSLPALTGEAPGASEQHRVLEHKAVQNVKEDDMYYGIQDGPGDDIPSTEAAFKPKD